MPEEEEDWTHDARMCDDCGQLGRWIPCMTLEEAEKAWKQWVTMGDSGKAEIIELFGRYACKSCWKKEKRVIKENKKIEKKYPEFYAAMVREDAVRTLSAKKAAPRTAMPPPSSAYGASSTSLAPRASDSRQSSFQAVPPLGSDIHDPRKVFEWLARENALSAKKAAPRTAMPPPSSAYGASSTSLAPRASDSRQSSFQAVPTSGSDIDKPRIVFDAQGMWAAPEKAAPRTAMPPPSSAHGASSTSLAPRASDSRQSSSQAVPALGSNVLDAYMFGDPQGMSASPEQYPRRSSQAAPPPRPTLEGDVSAATSAAQAPAQNRSDKKRQRR